MSIFETTGRVAGNAAAGKGTTRLTGRPSTLRDADLDPIWVSLLAEDGSLAVVALLGDGMPEVTGGGGWIAVDRPKRRPVTVWEAPEAVGMTLPLLLDGHASDTSVEGEVRVIERMAGALVAGDVQPPALIVTGKAVPHSYEDAAQNRWVIAEPPEWGDAIRNQDGDRTRQPVTLSLLLHNPPEKLERLTPATAAPSYRVAVAKQGDTFQSMAQRELGNILLAGELAQLNRDKGPAEFKHAHAATRIRTGAQVRLPSRKLQQQWEQKTRNRRSRLSGDGA